MKTIVSYHCDKKNEGRDGKKMKKEWFVGNLPFNYFILIYFYIYEVTFFNGQTTVVIFR